MEEMGKGVGEAVEEAGQMERIIEETLGFLSKQTKKSFFFFFSFYYILRALLTTTIINYNKTK